jgi:hypothetical protein
LQDLRDEDQLSLRHLMSRVIEQAIRLRRQQSGTEKAKEVESADGPELGRLTKPLSYLSTIETT